MYLGIRSFNYNGKAYAAYAVMDTTKEEFRKVLSMVNFEPDTDPDKVYLYLENEQLVPVAQELGWELFDEAFPDIVRKSDLPF